MIFGKAYGVSLRSDKGLTCFFLSGIAVYSEQDIAEASFLGCGHVTPDPRWHMPKAVHAMHELVAVVAGRMTVGDSQGRLWTAEPGSVLLYPAGAAHEERSDPDRPLESYYLSFTCPGLVDAPLRMTADSRGSIERMCAWLDTDRLTSHPAMPTQRQALLQAILSEFLVLLDVPDMPIVARTRRHIRAHIAEPIRLNELAELNSLSKYHFLRRYRAATGRTPGEEIRLMRTEIARDWIAGTNTPLKAVAERAGFADVYTLSRAFRRRFAMPPARYRRLHGEGKVLPESKAERLP